MLNSEYTKLKIHVPAVNIRNKKACEYHFKQNEDKHLYLVETVTC